MKQPYPPRLARRLFDWYCGFAKVEDLQGDLEEWFHINVKSKGLGKARFIYWKQVLALIFSYAIRKRKIASRSSSFNSSALSLSMIESYFKVAFRNIVRHKYFSIVNIIGLSIGMSIGLLLIALYSNIRSYDNFQLNKENIYRIISERTEGIETYLFASAPAVLGEKIQQEYPEVKSVALINSSFSGEAMLGKENIPLSGYYVDDNFLSVFTYEMLEGYAPTALKKPNTIVLTETAVEKLFGKKNPLGKVLEIRDLGSFEVTGVMKDHPKNSHLEFQVLVSYSTLPASIRENGGNPEQWTDFRNQYVYILMPDRSQTDGLISFLNHTSETMYSKTGNTKATFQLQKLTEITPGQEMVNSIGPEWDYIGLIIFAGIALLILLPACFNYTNISIARALKRAKEIGLRKTMGGQKDQIFFQFITETVVITLISLLGGFFMFMILRDGFHQILAEASNIDLSLTPEIILLSVIFALFTGLLAGALPAFYFSGLNPIQALKGQSGSRISGLQARKILTIFQFTLSFGFIIALVGFSRQYRYTLNYDFGFQKENILDVKLQEVNRETFRTEFSRLGSVHAMSMSSGILGVSYSSTWIQALDKKDSTEVYQLFIDDLFIKNFKLKLLAGKDFPSTPWQHEQFIIVNEEFLLQRKIPDPLDAIGKTFNVEGKDLEVIGVVKNFHYASLQRPIQSFFFRMDPAQFGYANMKVSFTDTHASITEMEKIWNTLIHDRKFSAQFFDEEIRESYNFYHTLFKVFGVLGVLAISISLLGLLGMVVYTSENKTKEVGIRKVMGASTFNITVLLSKDYMKLMLWAAVIAIPITIYLFDTFVSFMQDYHITLSVWDILLSFLILIILGLATIASQTFKTASTNPTETLKCE